MQSQQKKVKWSRGETADALEERTDTGITQVSVAKLRNVISDVYGNISRRPALKIIGSDPLATEIPVISANRTIQEGDFIVPPETFVFTINEDKYIIFIVDKLLGVLGGMLIHKNKFVKKVTIDNQTGLTPSYTMIDAPISAAQYNNFMVVANLYTKDVILRLTPTDDITVETFQFSAPWYAPEGNKTTQVSDSDIPGLLFDASSVGQYTYTEDNGITTVYSWIKTGLAASAFSADYTGPTVSYYLHRTGGRGSEYFYNTDPTDAQAGPFTITNGQTYTSGDQIGSNFNLDEPSVTIPSNRKTIIDIRTNSVYIKMNWMMQKALTELPRGDFDINTPTITDIITPGSIVQFPNNGAYMRVEGYDTDGTNLRMYGSFLTPIANDTATDKIVKVEYGYVSLNNYNPTKLVFSNQRLYASRFSNENAPQKLIPGYTVGSQVARYNDFKNNYNSENEPVEIDISTAYQEQIVGLVDYNGLKIFTDCAEYSYNNGGVIKQSENGSLTTCDPLVVGSVCIYADKSGHQLRAMQYELQSDLFTSSSINQMAQEDLIFNTNSMASYLDKEHCTGRFLYATQTKYGLVAAPDTDHSIAVCNFVPGNQAMIWSRWTSPGIKPGTSTQHTVSRVVEVHNKVWFVVACTEVATASQFTYPGYTLAELDYDKTLDIETIGTPSDTEFRIIPSKISNDMYAWVDQNNPNNVVYTLTPYVMQDDPIYDASMNQVATASNSPGGPNIVVGGVGYYEWDTGMYTKTADPEPTGAWEDPSRDLYDSNGDKITNKVIISYDQANNRINWTGYPVPSVFPAYTSDRIPSSTSLTYTIEGTPYTADYDSTKNKYVDYATIPGATVTVFDGDEYKWTDEITSTGAYTQALSTLTNPRIGFTIDAVLESHPIDVGGKTYTEKKRIGKAVAVIRNTDEGAFSVCDKTGYTSPDKKSVNFYGCTGMKDLIRYTINNIKGAKFTIESLTMIIEYGTLDS